jgi:peptidyl-prolyl cis-trans isomerase SurA
MTAMSLKRNLISGLAILSSAMVAIQPALAQGPLAPSGSLSGGLGGGLGGQGLNTYGPVAPRSLADQSIALPTPTLRVAAAAVVNDEVISTYDLSQRMQYMVLTTGVQPTNDNLPELQSDALEALLDERLEAQELRHKAKENKKDENSLFSDESEVTSYLNDLAKENKMTLPQFMQQLTSRGLTEKTVRDSMKIQLSWREFIEHYYGPRIRVGDDQVKQALARIADDASKPSYQTGMIYIDAVHSGGIDNAKNSAAQRMAQLQNGARFEALARQFSALPTAANGGDSGWLSPGEFPPEVAAVLPTMHQNEVRAVPTNDGVYLIVLHDKKEGGASSVVTLKQAAIPLPASATPAAVQAAEVKLTALKSKVTSCANLDREAQSAGLDADDLGESDVSKLLPAFRDAVVNLKVGQASNPVRSAQGLHLLVVCDKHAAGAAIPTKDELQHRMEAEQLTLRERVQLRDLRAAATIAYP